MEPILGYDKYITQVDYPNIKLVSMDEVLAKSDVITLHIPHAKGDTYDIGEAEFAKMKDGAYLVCAARGGIVDEEALVQALQSKKLAGAALDVFATEPPGACSLLECENFICTPHIGASTVEAQVNVARAAAEQVRDYLLKGEARFALNKD